MSLFLSMLRLRCFAHDLVASSRGYSPVAVHGLLMWRLLFLRSTCSEPVGFGSSMRGLSICCSQALEHRLGSCGPWAYLPLGTWDLPAPGIKPTFAVAGGFFTTEAPGNPIFYFLNWVLGSGVFTLLFAMYYYVWLQYFIIKNLKIL